MKTLKSVLAMALAATMLIGMMIVGSSAVVLKDAETIVNKEAVQVLTGLGIINGVPAADGSYSYYPTASISRAEAAKIIANVVAGYDVKEHKVTTQVFDDVKVTDWFAPYVHFCASKGIVSGWNNKFAPNDPVSPYALGKMILVANGYKGTDFEGTLWESEVSMVGRDIFKDVKTSGAAYATRDEAAAYLYNGFTKVEKVAWNKLYERYDESNTYILKNNYKVASFVGLVTTNSANSTNKTTTVGTTVVEAASGADLLGHYVKVWYKDTKTETVTVGSASEDVYGTYNDKEAVIWIQDLSTVVETAAVDSAAKWTAAFGTGTLALNSGVTVSGFDATTKVAPAGVYVIYNGKVMNYSKPIEYVTDKVADITTTANAEKIKLTGAGEIDNMSTSDKINEYAGIAKGDIVVYYKVGDIYNVFKAKTVEGKITKINDGKYTINGVEYSAKAAATLPAVDSDGIVDATANFTDTFKLYLTPDNKYFAISTVDTSTSTLAGMIYVTDKYEVKGTAGAYGTTTPSTYWVQGVDANGAEVKYQVKKEIYDAVGSTIATKNIYKVSLAEDTDSTNNLKATYATLAAYSKTEVNGTYKTTATVSTSAPVLHTPGTVAAATPIVYFGSNVKFIYVDGSLSTLKVSVTDRAELAKDAETAYYATKTSETATNATAQVVFVAGKPSTDVKNTNIVWVPGTESKVQVPYSAAGTTTNGWQHTVYINGVKTTVVTASNDIGDEGFYTYTVNSTNGLYTFASVTGTTTADKVNANAQLTNVYNNLITTKDGSGYTTADLTDASAANVVIVDLVNTAATATPVSTLDALLKGQLQSDSSYDPYKIAYVGTQSAGVSVIYVIGVIA